jgi:hypothetical protein
MGKAKRLRLVFKKQTLAHLPEEPRSCTHTVPTPRWSVATVQLLQE